MDILYKCDWCGINTHTINEIVSYKTVKRWTGFESRYLNKVCLCDTCDKAREELMKNGLRQPKE